MRTDSPKMTPGDDFERARRQARWVKLAGVAVSAVGGNRLWC